MAGMDAAVLSGMSKLQNAPAFRVMPYPLEPDFVPDAGLQDALEAATTKGAATPDLNPHGFALVDLSDDIAHPRYAGHQDTKQALIGSLAKLLPLYGAFELRRNLRDARMELGISDLNELANVTRANLARVNGTAGSRPLIEKLFKISDGELDFTFSGPPRHNDQFLKPLHDGIGARIARTTRPNPNPPPARITRLDDDTVLSYELTDFQDAVPAEDHLRLMAGWSDNVSAAVIIQALGFDHLWALTTRSGLYRRSWEPLTRNDREAVGPSGLLVTRPDYNYGGWRKLPAGVPGSPGQAGTARSIAVLMTMLALGVLVDSQSSLAMREMMRKQGLQYGPGPRWENSPIGRGMELAGWDANQPVWAYDGSTTLAAGHDLAVSKIGVTVAPAPETRSNAFIVRTKRNVIGGGQKLITAVLVSLNWTSPNANVGETFGKRMAGALEAKHNLVPGA
jgi:Beta-lactamase enzyme family